MRSGGGSRTCGDGSVGTEPAPHEFKYMAGVGGRLKQWSLCIINQKQWGDRASDCVCLDKADCIYAAAIGARRSQI